jgi:hypothetical protein
VDGGYGTYKLNEVKDLQNIATNYYHPLQIKAVQQFPGYYFYSASAAYPVNTFSLCGVSYDYYMSGGRNHLRDYSGEYTLDMPLSAFKLGVYYKNLFKNKNKFHLYYQLKFGIVFSKLKLQESMILYNVKSQFEEQTLNCKLFSFEPNTGMLWDIHKNISINISAGYDLNFGKNRSNDNPIFINWSGIRARAGLTYKFGFM